MVGAYKIIEYYSAQLVCIYYYNHIMLKVYVVFVSVLLTVLYSPHHTGLIKMFSPWIFAFKKLIFTFLASKFGDVQ